MKKWFKRTFSVITQKEAIKLDLGFCYNVHGENINQLNCRSIWSDKKGREYRVKEYITLNGEKLIERNKKINKVLKSDN